MRLVCLLVMRAAPSADGYLGHGQFLSRDRARAALADMFDCAPSRARWQR